ncbi:response regulator transcription factor [Yimella sp. cx-573]|nr:response regulator transcription factor [Yimella sp. cx-573]
MNEPSTRVLIVDDDALVVAGLASIIETTDDIVVAGTASDGDEGITAITRHHPDVVLLDVRMKRQDGITTTASIVRLPNAPRVIVLTTFDTDDIVRRAIQAGAAGFLLKTAAPVEILDSIRNVHRGGGALDRSKVRHVFDMVNASDSGRQAALTALAQLSDRERDVVIELARGGSNAEIGRRLFLGEATVKTHLGNAQRKLGVNGRVEVAVIVTKAGLV